jgi:hypothetical protein
MDAFLGFISAGGLLLALVATYRGAIEVKW